MPERIKFALTLVFFCFFLCLSSYSEVLGKILVIVNDEIITQGELDKILASIYRQYSQLYNGEELAKKLDEARQNVLQRLIQDRLLLSEAKRLKIEVEDKEVEKRINEVRKRFPNEDDFKEALAQENIVITELQKKFKERMMIDKLVDTEIRGRVAVSPAEIMNYYQSNKGEFEEPEKIKLGSILIKITDERTEEEASELIEMILARLKEGANFSTLAETYSDGPYAASGGDMGWVKKGELIGDINELIFSMEENGLSDILKTKLGFHIFSVKEKRPSRTKEFQEARGEIEKILFSNKIESYVEQWVKSLKKDAYIAFR